MQSDSSYREPPTVDLTPSSSSRQLPANDIRLGVLILGDGPPRTQRLTGLAQIVIGRSGSADVVIKNISVSRRHAVLTLFDEYSIEDLGSANGIWVGGRKIPAGHQAPLAIGEPVTLGAVTLVLQRFVPAADSSGIDNGELAAPTEAPGIVVGSGRMQELFRLAERVAAGSIHILILGETGVGKEVMAEHLHRCSTRAKQPLLRINCASLTESLLESELFGFERGAFTGAHGTKAGLLETADGGTVFLDEVGEISMSLQAKLLRVLEDKLLRRVGALKAQSADIRFISATNRNLADEVKAGRFRQDLFFRLNGVSLLLPPLRERQEEIPSPSCS